MMNDVIKTNICNKIRIIQIFGTGDSVNWILNIKYVSYLDIQLKGSI